MFLLGAAFIFPHSPAALRPEPAHLVGSRKPKPMPVNTVGKTSHPGGKYMVKPSGSTTWRLESWLEQATDQRTNQRFNKVIQ